MNHRCFGGVDLAWTPDSRTISSPSPQPSPLGRGRKRSFRLHGFKERKFFSGNLSPALSSDQAGPAAGGAWLNSLRSKLNLETTYRHFVDMDFFESQEQARHHTKALVIYFALAVAMMIAAIYAVSVAVFTGAHLYTSTRAHEEIHPEIVWWNPKLFVGVTAGTLAVIGLGSIFKTLALARGGSTVATTLGGRLVLPTTTEPNERKLLNVVVEMAI